MRTRGNRGTRAGDGRYSGRLPSRLLARYEGAARDPELLSPRDDVALLDAEIRARLAELRDGEVPIAWAEVRKVVDELVGKQRTWDWTTMEKRLEELSGLVDRGLGHDRAFERVCGLIDRKARLAQQEHRRMVHLRQFLTIEEALLVAGALTEAFRRVVGEPETLAVIERQFREILSIEER